MMVGMMFQPMSRTRPTPTTINFKAVLVKERPLFYDKIMIKYKFLIEKEACFAYWVRLIVFCLWPQVAVRWERGATPKRGQYYFDIFEDFNNEEKSSLEQFKDILENKKGVAQWFWDRYLNKEIIDDKERAIWSNLRNVLNDKFDKIWASEGLKLKEWQKILDDYDFNLNGVLEKIINFFGVKELNEELSVYLVLSFSNHALHAETKRFENLITLEISNLDFNNLNKAVSILLHETVHIIFERSQKDAILRASISEAKEPIAEKSEFFNLTEALQNYFVEESVVSSIAGQGANYINQKFFPENITEKEMSFFANLNYKENKNNYSYQTKAAASQFGSLTKEYLDGNKELDKEYYDFVIKSWARFMSEDE